MLTLNLTQEPLASVVLSNSKDLAKDVPEAPVMEVLTSIFRVSASQKDAIHGDDKYPLFASAFGASVLRCGFEGCNVRFYDPETATTPDVDAVRQRRARHLKEVFGEGDLASNTGLPEPTRAPKAPSSSHCNLHRSIARVWTRLDRTHVYNHGLLRRAFATSNGLPSKQDVYDGNERAITAFVSEVRVETCAVSCGNSLSSFLHFVDALTMELVYFDVLPFQQWVVTGQSIHHHSCTAFFEVAIALANSRINTLLMDRII